MDELAAFLLARYDEAEAKAKRAVEDAPDWYASRQMDERRSLRDCAGERIPETAATYIGDNGPAFVLRDRPAATRYTAASRQQAGTAERSEAPSLASPSRRPAARNGGSQCSDLRKLASVDIY